MTRARGRLRLRAKEQPPPPRLARAEGIGLRATVLDKLALRFAPAWGAQRLANRIRGAVLASALRKYDGADAGRRTQGWNTPGGSANAEVGPALLRLRRRSRDLVRNNAWAGKAVRALTTRIIGTGIRPDLDDDEVEETYREWAQSTACDFAGKLNLGGLQAKAARAVFESGEVLVRRIVDPSRRIPLQLQILEADHLDEEKTGKLASGGRIVQGVELDDFGRPRAYWIHPEHPGESWSPMTRSIRVDASEILHVFREDRPGQLRGLPWGSPVILPLHDWDEYADAQLLRQKIAAAFVGFVRDLDAEAGAGTEGSEISEEVTEFEPGVWEHLPAGKTIEFARPPSVEGFADYSSATLHQIAAGYGVTYEALTGDFEKVTFTSGRMGHLEFAAEVEGWQHNLFIPQLLGPIFAWFVDLGQLAGTIPSGSPRVVDWIPPRREMIDPGKELKSRIAAVRAGISTLSAELRREGKTPRKALEQAKADWDLIDELGLAVDSDPRRSASGAGSSAGGAEGAARLEELVELFEEVLADGDREQLVELLEARSGRTNGHTAPTPR